MHMAAKFSDAIFEVSAISPPRIEGRRHPVSIILFKHQMAGREFKISCPLHFSL